MNDDTITDLKQFISATVSQQISSGISELRDEMHDGFSAIDVRFENVDRRFVKLESDMQTLAQMIVDPIDENNVYIENRFKHIEDRVSILENRTI